MPLQRRQVLAGLGSTSLLVGPGCLHDADERPNGEKTDRDGETACTATFSSATVAVSHECEAGTGTEVFISGESQRCEELTVESLESERQYPTEIESDGSWSLSVTALREGTDVSTVRLLDSSGVVVASKTVEIDQPQTLFVHAPRLDTNTVTVGDPVTTTFAIENSDNRVISVTVELQVDGETVASREGTVAGHDMGGGPTCGSNVGPEQEFIHRFEEAGTYNLVVTAEGDGSYDSADRKYLGTVTVED